jgi:hypothetical protein
MTDFIVVSLFKATSSANPGEPIYREVMAQVRAFDPDSARLTAEERGRSRETEFQTPSGNIISWQFERVVEVSAMLETVSENGIKDLYSRDFQDFNAYKKLLGFE